MRRFYLFAALTVLAAPSLAAAPVPVILQNHKFTPSVIRVKANEPSMIILSNKDGTAEEFDSSDLKIEKVVAGGQSGNIRIRALKPGTYKFMGEYHDKTAQGVVIAE